MLVPLNFLIDMESLQLGENLDDRLLHSGFHHERTVVWGCETLLSDLYSVDWAHSVTDLIVLLGHKLTSSSVLKVGVLKNKNLSFLSKFDFV